MALTKVERERISDSRLKLQSAANSLQQIDREKLPGMEDIEDCLNEAEKTLSGALRGAENR